MLKIMKTYNRYFSSCIDNVGIAVKDVLENINNNYGPIEECTMFEVRVVLNELLLNAIKHGNNQDESKKVNIACGITDNGFACFIVEDEGCGYEYNSRCNLKIKNDIDNINELLESGRGILIVRSLCDSVKVNKRGNKVVVLKKL